MTALADVIAFYRQSHYLPDPTPLQVILAAYIGNHLPGDPCWPLLVGPPAAGKSELLGLLSACPDVHHADTLTVPGLLARGRRKEGGAATATSGLLAALGDFGVLMISDASTVLGGHTDIRSGVFGALRRIFDGSFDRRLDGQFLAWTGKCGLFMATTNAVDARLAEMGVLGQRFLVCRMPKISPEGRRLMCRSSVENAGRRPEQRKHLAQVTAQLLDTVRVQAAAVGDPVSLLESGEIEALIAASDLSAAARSPVERSTSWAHELEEGTGDPEAPARLADSTVRLAAGLALFDVEREERQAIVCKLALDALPSMRRRVLDQLVDNAPHSVRVADIMRVSGLDQRLVERGLEDLGVHGVAERHGTGLSVGNTWALSEWAWQAWYDARRLAP